jgi:hypothetical protein
MESFFDTLRPELVHYRKYATLVKQDAITLLRRKVLQSNAVIFPPPVTSA